MRVLAPLAHLRFHLAGSGHAAGAKRRSESLSHVHGLTPPESVPLSLASPQWAETGGQVNQARSAAKSVKASAILDDDAPKRRASKTMKRDEETMQDNLEKFLANAHEASISDKDILIVMDVRSSTPHSLYWPGLAGVLFCSLASVPLDEPVLISALARSSDFSRQLCQPDT